MLTGVDKVIATTLRPGIDEASYRELNGLSADEDVYSHYISNIGIAQVFDVEALNEEAAEKGELYGEGYTYGYDEASGGPAYYLDTPDGKVKVDPYLEGIGGGRGGDPRDFNNGVWTMEQYRKQVADPITLGGRLTYDMASILGDSSKQGQLITLNDFKELKDAGYNVTPFKDRFTGETVNGNTSYDDILANYMQERARMGVNYQKPKGYTPVDFMGYTEVTQDLHNDVIGFWKEQGLSDADARARAAETAPVGSILNENDRFSANSSLQDLVNFRDYIDTLEVGDDYKYSFNENYDQIMIAEATRLGGDADPSTIEAFLRNTSGLGLDAIGQLAQTMSYATILTNAAGLTDTAAEDTWLARFGEVLSDTGEGIQTDEYKAKVTKLNEDMAKAMSETEGFWGTVGAIGTTAWNNPTAFVSEYIVSEIFQELPLLVASGGTATLLKGGLSVGAKAVGKEFAENTLKRSGVSAALATSLATNVAEGFGGAAQDGYEKGLNTYNKVTFENLRKQGLSVGEARAVLDSPDHVAKAEKYATDLAEMAGVIGGGVALITAGLASGTPLDNLALEKALFGNKKAPDGFIKQLKDYASTVGKEGLAEGAEEGAISGFIEGRLSLIDPTRDVSGNNTAAALLGTISGAGTTGGILVGNEIVSSLSPSAATFVMTASPENLQKVGIGSFQGPTYTGAATDAPVVRPTLQQITAAAQEFGLDRDATDSLKNISYNSQIITKDEIKEYVQLTNPEFNFTDDTLEAAYTELGGEKATEVSNADLERLVNQFIDPLYMTREEAAKAGLAEGIVLTEEQIDEIVGDNNVTDETGEQDIIDRYDDLYTSRAEAEQFFEDLGYTPTEAEITSYMGATPDADQKEAIASYVDPRQVTEAEARKFFEDQGYDPTDEEVANYVGQGTENFETNKKDATALYVDPRQVTDAEARKFFSDLGYTPTDEEVAALVGQGAEGFQSDIAAGVPDYVNPRQITEAEARAALIAQGIPEPTQEQIDQFVGQGGETFATSQEEAIVGFADPLVTTYEEAKEFFTGLGFTPTRDQVLQFVGATSEEEQQAAVAEFVDPLYTDAEEAREFLESLGYTPTDAEVQRFTGQVRETQQEEAVGEYVDPRLVDADEVKAAYEALGLARPTDNDIQELVGQYMESELAGKAEEYLPTARYNSIINILDNFTGEVGVSDEMQEALDIVKKDMIDALGDLGLEVAAIDQTVDNLTEAVGAVASGDVEATGLYGYIDTAIQELKEAGLTNEEVEATIGSVVGSPATVDADGNEVAATGIYATIADIGETVDNLNDLSTDDVENIVTEAIGELENISAEDVGTIVDEIVGAPATDDAEATGLYATIGDLNNISTEDVTSIVTEAIGELENISAEDVENVVNGIVGVPATDDAEATGLYATLDSSTNEILDILGNPATDDAEATGIYGYIDSAVDSLGTDLSTLAGNVGTPAEYDEDGNVTAEATGIYAQLDDLMSQGMTNAEAIATLAADFGVAVTDLTNLFNETTGEISEDIGAVAGDVSDIAGLLGEPAVTDNPLTEEDESKDPTGLFGIIAGYEAAGQERDEAIKSAVGDLAIQLGTTEQNILDQMGLDYRALTDAIATSEAGLTEKIETVESSLTAEIGDVETSLTELINKNDGDVDAALAELATALGTTETNILAELGTTKDELTESFTTAIGDVEASLGADIDAVADLIGKPAREVTQTDIDFVIDLIAQENVSQELITQYDVTGDGIIDINDQTLLETALQGEEDVTLADTSMFTPATGIYGEIDTQTDAITDMITDLNTQINTKIDAQGQQEALRDLLSMEQAGLFKGAKTTVSSADPMNIDYLYDFSSVFANPSQQGLFASPYSTTTRNKAANQPMGPMPMASGFAKGGQVEDENDMLLRILGDM
jgi:hypothetical protein